MRQKENPGGMEYRHPGSSGPAHALRPIPEKGFHVLRVISIENLDPVAVVTVFFDDEVSDV